MLSPIQIFGMLAFVLIVVLYILALFSLSRSQEYGLLFYFLALLPYAVGLVMIILRSWAWYIIILYVIERVLWSITLDEAGEEDKGVWFFIIALFPLIGWILYRLVEVR